MGRWTELVLVMELAVLSCDPDTVPEVPATSVVVRTHSNLATKGANRDEG